MFDMFRRYEKKLNLMKCTFRVSSDKFLGFIVNSRGIEVNLEKIYALKLVKSPSTQKEMQILNGKGAALSRFISRAKDKCIYFFDACM